MSEPALSAKETAKNMLLEQELDIAAIAAATSLSEPTIRGLKGALVRAGELPSTKAKRTKKSAVEDDEEPLPGEVDILAQILKDAGLKKKAAVLKLVDHSGYDVESIYRALGSVGAGRSIKRTVITLWASQQGEEIPGYIEDELETQMSRDRERGRDRRLTEDEWREKNRFTRLEEKLDRFMGVGGGGGFNTRAQPGVRYKEIRVPIDAAGRPTDPNKAVSVRYERVPLGSGDDGQVAALRREIGDLKERMFSDQIAGLANQIEDLKERGSSDVGAIVSGVKDVLTSWSESEGGPLVKTLSPLGKAFSDRVLENYIGTMPPEMRNPDDTTPETLLEKLRGDGFVTKLRRRRGGGYAPAG